MRLQYLKVSRLCSFEKEKKISTVCVFKYFRPRHWEHIFLNFHITGTLYFTKTFHEQWLMLYLNLDKFRVMFIGGLRLHNDFTFLDHNHIFLVQMTLMQLIA